MALGTTNLTTTQVKNELGASSNSVSVLNTDTGINKWSFYKPGSLSISSQEFVYTADTSPYKFGDFRGYNHTTNAPYHTLGGTTFTPDDTNVSFYCTTICSSNNLKEANTNITHVHVKCYNDSGRTSLKATGSQAISWSTMSPSTPPGHSTTGTQIPTNPTLTEISFTKPSSTTTYYFDVFFADNTASTIAHLPTYQFTATATKLNYSTVTVNVDQSTVPAGWTAIFFVQSSNNSGGTTFDFNGEIQGAPSGGGGTVGVTCQADFDYYYDGSYHDISLNQSFTAGNDRSITGSTASGHSIATYGENVTVRVRLDSVSTIP